MIEEVVEVASAIAVSVKEAISLWEQYKAGEITKEQVLAALAKDSAKVLAARSAEDAEIAALPPPPK